MVCAVDQLSNCAWQAVKQAQFEFELAVGSRRAASPFLVLAQCASDRTTHHRTIRNHSSDSRPVTRSMSDL
jgi:hypothetical protein